MLKWVYDCYTNFWLPLINASSIKVSTSCTWSTLGNWDAFLPPRCTSCLKDRNNVPLSGSILRVSPAFKVFRFSCVRLYRCNHCSWIRGRYICSIVWTSVCLKPALSYLSCWFESYGYLWIPIKGQPLRSKFLTMSWPNRSLGLYIS